MTEGEFTTYSIYDFKKDIQVQYGIVYNLWAEYLQRPTYSRMKQARLALTKLVLPLFPKLYVLKDREAISYVAYFMKNPSQFQMADLQTIFLICQRVCEKIGLTKFEQFQIPKHKSFLEDE